MEVVVHCPHCRLPASITSQEIDAGAIYHGVMKKNGHKIQKRIPPEWVQYLKSNDLIYGCGKPFMVLRKSSVQFEAVPYNPNPKSLQVRRATVIPCSRVQPSIQKTLLS